MSLASSLLRPIPVRIASGPLEGFRFSLATGRRYRSGDFERTRIEAIEGLVQAGERFLDVGAHRGYVSLVASKSSGTGGRVMALEPSAENYRFLRLHAQWNSHPSRAPITAHHLAAAETEGTAWFGGGKSLTSSLQEGPSREQVEIISLDGFCERENFAPTFIKIDVEGAEARVLAGARAVLSSPQVAVLVATHSQDLYEECRSLLAESGLTIVESARVGQAKERGWDQVEDPELFAFGGGRSFEPAATLRFIEA